MPGTKSGGLESTRLFSFTMEDSHGKKPPKFEFCAGLISKNSPEKEFAQNLLMYVLSHLGTEDKFKSTGKYKSEKSGEVYHQPLVLSARMRSGMKVSVLGVKECLATLKKMASKMNPKVQSWIICYLIDWIYGRMWIANTVKPALSAVFNVVIVYLGIKKNPVFTKFNDLSKMGTGPLKKRLGWGQKTLRASPQPVLMQRRRGNTLQQQPQNLSTQQEQAGAAAAEGENDAADEALQGVVAAVTPEAEAASASGSEVPTEQTSSQPNLQSLKQKSLNIKSSAILAADKESAQKQVAATSSQKPTPQQERIQRQSKSEKSGTPRTCPRENAPSVVATTNTLERPKKRSKVLEEKSSSTLMAPANIATSAALSAASEGSAAAPILASETAGPGKYQKLNQRPPLIIHRYRPQYIRETGIQVNHVYPSDGGDLTQNGDLPPPKSVVDDDDDDMSEQYAPRHHPMMSYTNLSMHGQWSINPASPMTTGDCRRFNDDSMDVDSIASAFVFNCSSR